MNLKDVLGIGLKVALALGAGLAMFMGVSEAVRGSRQQQESNNTENAEGPVNTNKNTGGAVVSGLRAAQSTCGKLFNLAQGLVTIAESINTLSNHNDVEYYGGGYYPPYQGGGGQRWRRVNPFIMESVPSGAPINYSNQYPY